MCGSVTSMQCIKLHRTMLSQDNRYNKMPSYCTLSFIIFYLPSAEMTVTADTQSHHGPQSKHTLADNSCTIQFMLTSMQNEIKDMKKRMQNGNKLNRKGRFGSQYGITKCSIRMDPDLRWWCECQLCIYFLFERTELFMRPASVCIHVQGYTFEYCVENVERKRKIPANTHDDEAR